MTVSFPVSGLEIFPLFPPLIAFVIGLVCSMAGVTGAFLLLPVQISLFGFTGPSVTATNHVYTVFAGIGGPIRYRHEGRMLFPLAGVMIAGVAPGITGGMLLRVMVLPDPGHFKAFVAVVLLLLGTQVLVRALRQNGGGQSAASPGGRSQTESWSFSLRRFRFRHAGREYAVNVPLLFAYSLAVGVVSGAYGMGGGSLLAAYLVGVCHLPLHTTAGATMITSFTASIMGTISFSLVGRFIDLPMEAGPDWLLGITLGLGGLAGTYTGAMLQRHIPARVLSFLLAGLILAIAIRYSAQTLF